MKGRNIVILLVLCVGLGFLYFYRESPHHVDVNNSPFTELIPDFSVDAVDEITAQLKKGGSATPFHIVKRDTVYWIDLRDEDSNTTYPAPCDNERIKRLLTSLRGLKGEERAQGKKHLPTFHLLDEDALEIIIRDGKKELAHLLVGKRGPTWDTSFVRKAGDDRVFLVQKNLLSLFDIWSETATDNPPVRPWIDLAVLRGSSDEVQGVSYSSSDLVWSLARGPSANGTTSSTKAGGNATGSKAAQKLWHYTMNGESVAMDQEALKGFLRSIFPLYAKGVEPPSKRHEFGLGKEDESGRFAVHYKTKGVSIFHVGRVDTKKKVGWIMDDRQVIYQVPMDVMEKIKKGPGSKTSQKEGPKKEEQK